MTLSKRSALGISLAVIAMYWVYLIASQRSGHALPADFSAFALRVAINKCIVIGSIFLLLRLEGEWFGQIGVNRRAWPRHVGIGVGIGLAMFFVFNVGLSSIMGSLFPRATDSGPSVMAYFRQPANLMVWLPIGIFGGGVVEELQRIFVMTRFEKWLGRPGLVLGVILSSMMFGFGHLYQGLGIAIATAVSGAVLALVYLRERSALEPIAAHALSDILAMLGATMLAHH